MIINKRMDKQIVLYSYSRVLFSSLNKKKPIDTWNNMAESQTGQAKRNQPKNLLYDSIYMKFKNGKN